VPVSAKPKATIWTENDPDHGVPVLCIRSPWNGNFVAHLKEALPRSARWFDHGRKLWLVELAYRRDAEAIVREYHSEVLVAPHGDPNLATVAANLENRVQQLQDRLARPASNQVAQLQAQVLRLQRDLADMRDSRAQCQRELHQLQRQQVVTKGRTPYEVLARALKPDSLKRFYHLAAHDTHPDQGGSTTAMQAVNQAWEQIKKEHKL
jgi:TolA-binding protein